MVNTWQWTHSGLVTKGQRFFFVIVKVGELFFTYFVLEVLEDWRSAFGHILVPFILQWSLSCSHQRGSISSKLLKQRQEGVVAATADVEGAKRGEGGWVGKYAN